MLLLANLMMFFIPILRKIYHDHFVGKHEMVLYK